MSNGQLFTYNLYPIIISYYLTIDISHSISSLYQMISSLYPIAPGAVGAGALPFPLPRGKNTSFFLGEHVRIWLIWQNISLILILVDHDWSLFCCFLFLLTQIHWFKPFRTELFKVLIRRTVPGKAPGTKLNPQTSPTELLQWIATKSMAQICTDMHTYLASLQHTFFQKWSLTHSYSRWTHSVSWNPHPPCHQLLLRQVSLTLRWHFCWGCDNVASCRQWPWSNHSYVIADRVPNPVVSDHTQFLDKLKCLSIYTEFFCLSFRFWHGEITISYDIHLNHTPWGISISHYIPEQGPNHRIYHWMSAILDPASDTFHELPMWKCRKSLR